MLSRNLFLHIYDFVIPSLGASSSSLDVLSNNKDLCKTWLINVTLEHLGLNSYLLTRSICGARMNQKEIKNGLNEEFDLQTFN